MPTHSRPLVLLLLILLSATAQLHAQRPQLGKVYPESFDIQSPLIGPATDAVIIADTAMSTVESYEYGWRLSYHRHRRVKILNNKGLKTFGSFSIRYSARQNKNDKLRDLKAVTYNLRDGKVVSTSLQSKDMYLVRVANSDRLQERFAFPDVAVGSIIEYSYTFKSGDLGTLIPWDFQGKQPHLWSQYAIVYPDMFNYAPIIEGKLSFYEMSTTSRKKEMWVGNGNVDHDIFTKRWTVRDVPAITAEPFVSSMENYLARIKFQLSSFPMSYSTSADILRDWDQATDLLLSDDAFGNSLIDENHWLDKCVDSVVAGSSSKMEDARRLHAYVRDKFTCVANNYYLTAPLPIILDLKEGTTADINLLLVAMLRHRGIIADPVILATRDNGLTNPNYPVMDNFNYVICRVRFDKQVYYLDASVKYLGFDRLPLKCYNGHARVITVPARAVFFQPDDLHEDIVSKVAVRMDGNGFIAHFQDSASYEESLNIRRALKDKSQDAFFKDLAGSFPKPASVSNYSIDALDKYEQPVVLHYSARLDPEDNGDLLYFNPMLAAGVKKNPYPAGNRVNPVELPYVSSISYTMDLEVPKGYVVEELPASDTLVLRAPDHSEDARCEYRLIRSGDHIWLQYRMQMEKASLPPDRYLPLRTFIDDVLKKEHQMIVLRRTEKASAH